jgi:hypothetical protein
MLIGLLSTGGSPGVTTTTIAVGAMWPGPVVVVDADPSGGDILAAAGGAVEADRERNLLELMRLGRQSHLPEVLDSQITVLPTGVPVVAGLGHPGQAGAVSWTDLAEGLRAVNDRDVLVDLGRWGMPYAPAPLLWACDVVLLVVRTQLRGLRRAERALPLIAEDLDRHNPGAGSVNLLVVNDHGPYAIADIARRVGVPVLGELPLDTQTAAVFSDGAAPGRHLDRSPLVRALGSVVRTSGQLGQQRRALGTRAPLIRQQPATPTPVSLRPTPIPAAAPGVGLREMSRSPHRLAAVPRTETES